MKSLPSTVNPQAYFANIEQPKIQRSTFDRSHGHKTTFDAGKLIPVYLDEALPGDTFNMKATMFGRLATPLKPIMDNIHFDLHFFSVPYRLVWENWEKFNGAQDNPGDSTDFLIPTVNATASTGYGELSIQDYMGLPTKIVDYEHSVLPLRAYNLIYNEWYRDQNLQDSVTVDLGDSDDVATTYSVLDRNKRKDYFTSALPFAQKGTAVDIPIGTSAPITGQSTIVSDANAVADFSIYNRGAYREMNAGTASLSSTNTAGVAGNKLYIDGSVESTLEADLSSATAATVNELRQAFQIQRMYERDARGGTRYIEMIKAHFGVTSPDFRLQRPEYLGGGSTDVNMTPIANTSADGTNVQGDLSAVGTFSVNNNGFTKTFTEHEIVIGIVSARADMTYQQGLDKMWSRSTRFDFYYPSLAHLGEQAILNKELYCQDPATDTGSTGTPNNERAFGYQERFAEYRYKPSKVTGLFRSNATASLDVWHLAQEYGSQPDLNSDFIKENPPIDRVIATPSEPQFILDCYFNLKCTRPMPVYATPGLIDHF